MVAGDPSASLLSNITQLDPIYVNFAAPDSDVESVRSGLQNGSLVLPEDGKMGVQITLGDGGVYPLEGKVDFTDSLIDRGTGTVSARAVVPNPEQTLLPGQFVRVQVKGLSIPNAMTLPERAIAQGPGGTFVYVVDEGGVARMRQVTTGHTAKGRWVIVSGISAGDRVIVEGLPKVSVSASYAGASAQVIAETVAAPLEQSINGVEGMIYQQSNSGGNAMSLSVYFE
ncbi:predicted protein, partial [Nematostella vectensis]